jgi:hypothetical protein
MPVGKGGSLFDDFAQHDGNFIRPRLCILAGAAHIMRVRPSSDAPFVAKEVRHVTRRTPVAF